MSSFAVVSIRRLLFLVMVYDEYGKGNQVRSGGTGKLLLDVKELRAKQRQLKKQDSKLKKMR